VVDVVNTIAFRPELFMQELAARGIEVKERFEVRGAK
jgi:predicted nuclease with RNAse H fold